MLVHGPVGSLGEYVLDGYAPGDRYTYVWLRPLGWSGNAPAGAPLGRNCRSSASSSSEHGVDVVWLLPSTVPTVRTRHDSC